jgi:hypothetical protein
MPGECLHGDRGLGVREAWSDLVAEQRDRSESEARGTGSPGDASQTILRPDSVMKVSRAVWAGWRVTFRAVHPRRARAGGQTPCSIGHASRKRSGAYRLQTGEQWRRTANGERSDYGALGGMLVKECALRSEGFARVLPSSGCGWVAAASAQRGRSGAEAARATSPTWRATGRAGTIGRSPKSNTTGQTILTAGGLRRESDTVLLDTRGPRVVTCALLADPALLLACPQARAASRRRAGLAAGKWCADAICLIPPPRASRQDCALPSTHRTATDSFTVATNPRPPSTARPLAGQRAPLYSPGLACSSSGDRGGPQAWIQLVDHPGPLAAAQFLPPAMRQGWR